MRGRNIRRQHELREVRQSIKQDIPRIKRFAIRERPAPNSFIQHTAERVSGAKLKKKPVVYVWRPVGKVRPIKHRGQWQGSLNAFDVEASETPRRGLEEVKGKTRPRNFVVMPESTYDNPTTRAQVYAHELVEYIRAHKGDTTEEAHKRALKVEKPIARKYGTTPRQATHQMRKDFNEAYAKEKPERQYPKEMFLDKTKKKRLY